MLRYRARGRRWICRGGTGGRVGMRWRYGTGGRVRRRRLAGGGGRVRRRGVLRRWGGGRRAPPGGGGGADARAAVRAAGRPRVSTLRVRLPLDRRRALTRRGGY